MRWIGTGLLLISLAVGSRLYGVCAPYSQSYKATASGHERQARDSDDQFRESYYGLDLEAACAPVETRLNKHSVFLKARQSHSADLKKREDYLNLDYTGEQQSEHGAISWSTGMLHRRFSQKTNANRLSYYAQEPRSLVQARLNSQHSLSPMRRLNLKGQGLRSVGKQSLYGAHLGIEYQETMRRDLDLGMFMSQSYLDKENSFIGLSTLGILASWQFAPQWSVRAQFGGQRLYGIRQQIHPYQRSRLDFSGHFLQWSLISTAGIEAEQAIDFYTLQKSLESQLSLQLSGRQWIGLYGFLAADSEAIPESSNDQAESFISTVWSRELQLGGFLSQIETGLDYYYFRKDRSLSQDLGLRLSLMTRL